MGRMLFHLSGQDSSPAYERPSLAFLLPDCCVIKHRSLRWRTHRKKKAFVRCLDHSRPSPLTLQARAPTMPLRSLSTVSFTVL